MLSGCRAGYGIFVWGSSQPREQAWKRGYVENFACKQCAPGEVPFLPGSNIELVCDGSSWTIQLINDGTGDSTEAALQAAKPRTSNITAALTAAATVAAAAETAVDANIASDWGGFPEMSQEAISQWYNNGAEYYGDQGGCGEPPVFPGECVQCPEGSHQDGFRCKWCRPVDVLTCTKSAPMEIPQQSYSCFTHSTPFILDGPSRIASCCSKTVLHS